MHSWTYLDSKLGTEHIDITSIQNTWKEILFICRFGTSQGGLQGQCCSQIVSRVSVGLVYFFGDYVYARVFIDNNRTYAYMTELGVNGTDHTATSRCYVYYR